MNSIPASKFVSVIPSVLSAGGSPLVLNAVFLTQDPSIPTGSAQAFVGLQSVEDWFGAQSPEAIMAGKYFAGFSGANILPSTLYFYRYNLADDAAYLRSGSLEGLPLATLQSYAGTLIVTIDGRIVTSPSIDLSSSTSFSNAAALIQAGLQTTGSIFAGTGTLVTGTPNLTIASVTSGKVHIGDTVVGVSIPGSTTIESQTSGAPGGIGVYVMSANASATVASPEAIDITSTATVAYDALREAFVISSSTDGVDSTIGFATGTLATHALLTSATGAVLSQGAAAATPASAMNGLVNSTQNWATFTTVWEADTDTALLFADWVTGVSPAGQERFAYVEWDSDLTETTGPAPDSFGAQVKAGAYNGVYPQFDLDAGRKAAFVCGTIASIDFTETQGSTTLAYRSQAGLSADVTSIVAANNLEGNAYNYYGAVATANDGFVYEYPGSMPGVWKWMQPYINQIWMNSGFQLALLTMLTSLKSLPYNTQGYNQCRAALLDPILAAVNFGAIQPNVPLSASQAQQVNTAAGVKIDGILSTVGWYLQIKPASPLSRANRTTPPMTFWYTDGGSIQQINLASIDIQ